jgi:hypothetical protein
MEDDLPLSPPALPDRRPKRISAVSFANAPAPVGDKNDVLTDSPALNRVHLDIKAWFFRQ